MDAFVSIDTSAAEAMEGVEAVFTGAQIAEMLQPMPIGTPFPSPEHRAVAVDIVRYGGEPVAVVVASDRYVARDAAEAIVVTYDMLPAVVDLETGDDGQADTRACRLSEQHRRGAGAERHRRRARRERWTIPPIDAAFKKAEVVISQRMVNQRLAPSAMEPRGVVAHYEPGKGTMTIWSSTQNPHILRTFIAALNGLGQDQVRAIAPEVGGGFGAKINIYGEEYVAAAVSKRLGIPVKWIEDRSEAFVATMHGRDILGYVDLAAKRDGTVLGLKLRLIADIGAYNMLLTAAIPTLTMMMANAHLQHPRDPHHADRGLHEQDADRRVSRRRASRGDVLRRARDGHARARAEDGSGRASPEEFHPAEPVPVHDADGRGLRLGRLRERARRRAEGGATGSSSKAERDAARARGTAGRPRARDVRRGLRHRSVRRRCRPAAGNTRR